MEHNDVRELFAAELAGEPPAPAIDIAAEAIAAGTRLRRRRTTLLSGGATLGVGAVLTVAVLVGVPGRGGTTTAAAPPSPSSSGGRCTQVDAGDIGLGRLDVSLYLVTGVSATQRADVNDALRADPLVRRVSYQGREDAYRRFAELWKDDPDVVRAVGPTQLPESFRIELKDPSTRRTFVTRFAGRPGVGDLVDEAAATAGMNCLAGVPSGGR